MHGLLAVLLGLALALFAPEPALAGFGLTSSGGFCTLDTDAGLIFKVNQANGDITSLVYNGTEYQCAGKGSHINSGLGASTVTGTTIGTDFIRISVTDGTGTLTHHYLARRGYPHVYMATRFTQEPGIGLVRFIVRIPNGLLPNGPVPSDIRNNTGAIESADIFGMADGTTRSKHYSDQRLIDWSFTGATGTNVAAWMVRSDHEGDSGGIGSAVARRLAAEGARVLVHYGSSRAEAEASSATSGRPAWARPKWPTRTWPGTTDRPR